MKFLDKQELMLKAEMVKEYEDRKEQAEEVKEFVEEELPELQNTLNEEIDLRKERDQQI